MNLISYRVLQMSKNICERLLTVRRNRVVNHRTNAVVSEILLQCVTPGVTDIEDVVYVEVIIVFNRQNEIV